MEKAKKKEEKKKNHDLNKELQSVLQRQRSSPTNYDCQSSLCFHNFAQILIPPNFAHSSFYAKNRRLKKTGLCMSLERVQSRPNPAASITRGTLVTIATT